MTELLEGEQVHELLILGWRITNTGKLVMAFKPLDAPDLTTFNYFSTAAGKKSLTGAKPGAIWTRVADTENKWYTSGEKAPKFARMHPDAELVKRLQIESKVAVLENDAALRAKKDQELDRVLEGLEPLRLRYSAATPVQRRAILVLALEYIQKGR